MERHDLDIPEGTVWPATEDEDAGAPIGGTADEPVTLDEERDDVDRNAAGGGWAGVNEQIENDFETEQLRRQTGD